MCASCTLQQRRCSEKSSGQIVSLPKMGILTESSTATISATTTPPLSSISSSSSSSLSPQPSPTFPASCQLLNTGRSQFNFDPKLLDRINYNQVMISYIRLKMQCLEKFCSKKLGVL